MESLRWSKTGDFRNTVEAEEAGTAKEYHAVSVIVQKRKPRAETPAAFLYAWKQKGAFRIQRVAQKNLWIFGRYAD